MRELRKCKECGDEFIATNGMQQYCNKHHERICCICGKPFYVPKEYLAAVPPRLTCSKVCGAILRKQTNIEKYGGVAPAASKEVQEKMKATTLNRYGVEHAAQADIFKEKTRQSNLQKYGVDSHTKTDKFRENLSKKWKDEEFRNAVMASREATNLERYGCKNPMQNVDVRKRMSDTYFEKTGYTTPFANPEVQSQIESTNLERYGVRRPLQNDDIKKNWHETNRRLYGYANPMQNVDIQEKVKNTCISRYGNACFLQSELGLSKTREAFHKKYGVDYFSQSHMWKLSRMLDPSKVSNLMKFRENPAEFVDKNFESSPSIRELAAELGIHENTAGQLILDFGLEDKIDYVYSYMENEVYNFLIDLDPHMSIERNTHRVITPYELDIYLPEYHIGIECNPTSTHNSSINTFSKTDPPINYDYHLMKTKKCQDEGIFLFHIFGSEWTYSKDIIKSMIKNLLGKTDNVIYARNTEVKEVSGEVAKKFLNENHRQGNANSSTRLGLYLEDELVSLMTFGKMRATIGTSSKEDLSNCYELVRFCSKLNTNVVGGASKLFKHFLKEYHPVRIRSFSDRAHTKGSLYEKLGFHKVRTSNPGYVWVDAVTDLSYHRVNAQKQNIRKFLQDDSIDLTKTEKQIMEEHGFLQVYDCGTITWEWKMPN